MPDDLAGMIQANIAFAFTSRPRRLRSLLRPHYHDILTKQTWQTNRNINNDSETSHLAATNLTEPHYRRRSSTLQRPLNGLQATGNTPIRLAYSRHRRSLPPLRARQSVILPSARLHLDLLANQPTPQRLQLLCDLSLLQHDLHPHTQQ